MDPQNTSQFKPHVFFFRHSILFEVILFVTSLIDMSFLLLLLMLS
jgi:hypothetical protein